MREADGSRGAPIGAGVGGFTGNGVNCQPVYRVDLDRGGCARSLVYEPAAEGRDGSLLLGHLPDGPGAACAQRAELRPRSQERGAAVGADHFMVGFGEGPVEGSCRVSACRFNLRFDLRKLCAEPDKT